MGKVATSLKVFCYLAVHGECNPDEYDLIFYTPVEGYDTPEALCAFYSHHNWNEIITLKQLNLPENRYNKDIFEENLEYFYKLNLQKAQEIFWSLWMNGKVRKFPHKSPANKFQFEYESVQDFVEALNHLTRKAHDEISFYNEIIVNLQNVTS